MSAILAMLLTSGGFVHVGHAPSGAVVLQSTKTLGCHVAMKPRAAAQLAVRIKDAAGAPAGWSWSAAGVAVYSAGGGDVAVRAAAPWMSPGACWSRLSGGEPGALAARLVGQ